MKISITGSGGFIGRYLVSEFESTTHEVYRVPTEYLQSVKLNPEHEDCEITAQIRSSDYVIHLAARNNDQTGTDNDFNEDNFILTKSLIEHCKLLGVGNFIFSSSTKCLESRCNDPYTVSKRAAEKHILEINLNSDTKPEITVLRLPPVYGINCKGTLRFLAKIPSFLRKIAIPSLRSLTPICSLESLKNAIYKTIESDAHQYEVMVSDPLGALSPYWLYYSLITILFVVGTILLSPLLIAVAIAIRMTSKGPAIFVQERVGKNKKKFNCVKFRTMAADTPNVGTHEVGEASVTSIGSILRKTKIDELPQVINVLKGEMTLVGPRPCLPVQTEVVSRRSDHSVYSILPGITGHAQVNKVDMSRPRLISIYDQRYVRSRSILGDIKICIDTALGKGKGDPAFNRAE